MIAEGLFAWGALWTGLGYALGLALQASPGAPARLDVGELYQRHGASIYRRICRFYDRQEAEEVLHEVFLIALERAADFRGDASPSTWLYRVATNHCINRLRNSARRRALWLEAAPGLDFATSAGASQEAAACLRQLWRELPEELVMIGVYYHVDGLSHEEIAALIGVSRRTVGNRLIELEAAAKRLASSPGA